MWVSDFLTSLTPRWVMWPDFPTPVDGGASEVRLGEAEAGPDEGGPAGYIQELLLHRWVLMSARRCHGDATRPLTVVSLSELTVDQLHAFANCSGFQLIFGLNALLRTADNSWNNSNAALLLQYCQSRHYGMSWELGNGTTPSLISW